MLVRPEFEPATSRLSNWATRAAVRKTIKILKRSRQGCGIHENNRTTCEWNVQRLNTLRELWKNRSTFCVNVLHTLPWPTDPFTTKANKIIDSSDFRFLPEGTLRKEVEKCTCWSGHWSALHEKRAAKKVKHLHPLIGVRSFGMRWFFMIQNQTDH